MAMLVLDKSNPFANFDFRSWVLYDPRPSPGFRYLALMNEVNDPVCEGYYVSLVFNTTAAIAMTCFPHQARGRGSLRFHTLQEEGLFAGKSAGTGILETDTETVLFVHGATADETKKSAFKDLWDEYGGGVQRELNASEVAVTRISSLPKLPKKGQTVPASGTGSDH